MKRIIPIFTFLLLVSCQSEIKKEDLSKLNGYWGIKEVELPNGEKKDYKINETIDYYKEKYDFIYHFQIDTLSYWLITLIEFFTSSAIFLASVMFSFTIVTCPIFRKGLVSLFP